MKNRQTVITLLAAAFLTSSLLHAEPANLHAQLEAIRNLLKPDNADSPEVKSAKAQFKSLTNNWQRMLDKDRLVDSSDYDGTSMGYDLSAMPELAAKAKAFMQSVKQETERREAAKISEAEALLAQTAEQLKNARKPEDLDAMIQKLSKSKITEYGSNPKLSALSSNLQNALQITSSWQSYLMAKEAGKNSDCRSSLQNISSYLTSNPIIPRSYVLRLLDSVPTETSGPPTGDRTEMRSTMEDIITRLTDTGDTAAAMAELKPIFKTLPPGHNEFFFYRAIQATDDLRKLEPSLSEAEVITFAKNNYSNYTEQRRHCLTRANNQTVLNAIARSYGIETPSVKTTTPLKVLDSIATAARDKQDWPRLRQAATSLTIVNAGNTEDTRKYANDITLASLLIAANNAEQRNDPATAATTYLEASTLDGMYLHRDLIDSKIADLRQKFPDVVAETIRKAEAKRAH